jgi:hypothetical protein
MQSCSRAYVCATVPTVPTVPTIDSRSGRKKCAFPRKNTFFRADGVQVTRQLVPTRIPRSDVVPAYGAHASSLSFCV